MGALDAFSKAFSLVTKNKKACFLVIIAYIAMALMVFILPAPAGGTAGEHTTIIFEEYGAPSAGSIFHDLKQFLLGLFITVLILSLVEYTVVKAYYLSVIGEKYSLATLLWEALPRIPAVILIKVLAYLTSFIIGAIPLGLTIIGALTISPALSLLGVSILLLIIPVVLTFFALVVPSYLQVNGVGAIVEAFQITIRNIPSSFGYGVLFLLLSFTVSIGMVPLLIPLIISNASPLTITLLEVPFKAFLTCFLWAGGVLLYLDFKEINERKEEEFLY